MSNEPKFKVGQRVWFTKSMRMCVVREDYGDCPPHGRCYSVEVMDSGKRLFVPEAGLELCEGQEDSSPSLPGGSTA